MAARKKTSVLETKAMDFIIILRSLVEGSHFDESPNS
jgi:hypothetical protein